jgi:hypothetical protein
MGDLEIYPVLIPFALLLVALVTMRVIAYVNGNTLPLLYFAGPFSERLNPERLHRYRALRKAGLGIGLPIIVFGYVLAVAADASPEVRTMFYSVGVLLGVSGGFYLEYCMATGRISPPASE